MPSHHPNANYASEFDQNKRKRAEEHVITGSTKKAKRADPSGTGMDLVGGAITTGDGTGPSVTGESMALPELRAQMLALYPQLKFLEGVSDHLLEPRSTHATMDFAHRLKVESRVQVLEIFTRHIFAELEQSRDVQEKLASRLQDASQRTDALEAEHGNVLSSIDNLKEDAASWMRHGP
ncbi:hypothetical protein P152DRAFT_459553 [Eremomyces bilateralis CBS 781.70]|uniref:Uncharacterized protein n=1 Tax=Eremomyces bilateralis CBS 781.70 TaxID=1392243 RepID=A0A6G1G0Q0_9PEZI|nr:uncharacterized protein P152DRAFT_459553 [Eremomyces bilateralis CBS 781.70]KAF1811613.1 hypothetical protein P152DRAFT_459553 [Eremomyces bilateralis CBS 781.70]